MGDTGDFPPPLHPSALPDAPDPIEPQLLFLRGSAYLQQAVRLIELAVLDLEGLDEYAKPKESIPKSKLRKSPNILPSTTYDASEIRLCFLQESLYGGVEADNPAGPLGYSGGPKVKAYREVLAAHKFRENITSLVKKSIRDQERFLAHFDSLEADLSHEKGKGCAGREDLKEQTEYAFLLSESTRPGNYSPSGSGASSPLGDSVNFPPPATMFTTYHPLIVESHYMILLALFMLGNFSRILPTYIRTAALVDGLEGYPVFLPPRSMAQAEFVEVLERLGSGWKKGSFEDEFALVVANGRNGTITLPSSSSLSAHAVCSTTGSLSSGSTSPETTATELLDDVPGSIAQLSAAEGGSSTSGNEPGSSSSGVGTSSAIATRSSSPSINPPASTSSRPDAADALDSLRILLAPVIARRKERIEAAAAEREKERATTAGANSKAVALKGKGTVALAGASSPKKSIPINIPLHGPRVEIVLAWLGAVHLPELGV